MRLTCLAAVFILVGSAAGMESVFATEVPASVVPLGDVSSVSFKSATTLAQYDSDSQSSSGSTRIRTRGLGKLIGLVIAGIVGLVGFVIKLFRGND